MTTERVRELETIEFVWDLFKHEDKEDVERKRLPIAKDGIDDLPRII